MLAGAPASSPTTLSPLLACPRCGGRLRLIAAVEDPQVIREILAGLARSAERADRAPPFVGSVHANQAAEIRA
jgi:hypothetical protein